MPEGDTLHQAAASVGSALTGKTLTAVEGSHSALRIDGRRLVGATVEEVKAIGKHLVVTTSSGWALRTHLGMSGSWHTYAPDERWRTTPGKARVVLRAASAVAVCFAAPYVEVAPTPQLMAGLERIGPDLARRSAAFGVIVRRARSSDAPTVADLLLDQEVAAGIGNVYKSEVMFLEGQSPTQLVSTIDDAQIAKLYRRANRLLLANVGDARRTTTGNRGRQRTWVYGRGGRPCRRCGSAIQSATHGPLTRVTYWCPSCQHAPQT